jgi:hypothetical protein
LQLANLDNGALERFGRYETARWREADQVILMLDLLRRQNLGLKSGGELFPSARACLFAAWSSFQ